MSVYFKTNCNELKNLNLKNWNTAQDDVGIVWLELDRFDKSTNSLSSEVVREFGLIVNILDEGLGKKTVKDLIKGLVIYSQKTTGFCAGADVNEFVSIAEKGNWEAISKKIMSDGWYIFEKFQKIGATILNLTERPYTDKINTGDEPISYL